jgi:hypothetical protein
MHNWYISDHKTKLPVSYDKLKERYKPQMLYHVNMDRLTYIARCIQCGLDLPFKSIFGLCWHKQGSCHVDTWEISECYISCLIQDLESIFRVPIRNTMIKNGQDLKRHMKFYLNLWLCPFNKNRICWIDFWAVIQICFPGWEGASTWMSNVAHRLFSHFCHHFFFLKIVFNWFAYFFD